MKIVKTYNSRIEAFADLALLDQADITADITSDDAGGMRPDVGMASGGVKLVVSDKNLKRAKEILQETPEA